MVSRNYIFTLNNPTEQLTFPACVKYASWQKERGENGTEHYQGYMELDKPTRVGGIKKWAGGWPRAHLEVRRGTRDQARDYTRKEDSRIEGPWEHGDFNHSQQGKRNDLKRVYERLEEGASVDEVTQEYPETVMRYISGVKHAAGAVHRLKRPRMEAVLKGWQQQIVDIASGEPDTRKIHWFIDEQGNSGKSFIVEYLTKNMGALPLGNGKHAQLLHAAGEARPRIVTFDFPRSVVQGDNDRVPYGVIEAIKNGMIFSGMYGMPPVVFDKPHIFCFSNFQPDQTQLSADRWDIHYVQ